MGPVDVGAHGGEAIGEAFRHETLSGQVIALIELLLGENVKYAGVAVQAGGVNVDAVQAAFQAAQTLPGLLQRDAPHQPMNLIAQIQKVFGQIASILPRDSRNERCLFHNPFLSSSATDEQR